jgi:hypothetical protein
MEHTTKCLSDYEQITAARAEWFAAHPGYCKECEGAGGKAWPATYEDPGDFEMCEACVGEGKCPHCGGEMVDKQTGELCFDYAICPACGWDEQADTDAAPEPAECECDQDWPAPDEHLESMFEEQFENAQYEGCELEDLRCYEEIWDA